MATTKKKLPTVVTPPGIAVWPHLNSPDKYEDGPLQYTTKLKFDPSDKAWAAFAKKMDALVAEAEEQAVAENGAKAKRWDTNPWRTEELDEDGEPTDMFLMNFKMKATVTSRATGEEFDQRPALFDANNQPLKDGIRIGGGSTIRIAFQAVPYGNTKVGVGVSLRLKAIRVIDLVTFGGSSAEDMFGEAEDGFTVAEDTDAFPEDAEDGEY